MSSKKIAEQLLQPDIAIVTKLAISLRSASFAPIDAMPVKQMLERCRFAARKKENVNSKKTKD